MKMGYPIALCFILGSFFMVVEMSMVSGPKVRKLLYGLPLIDQCSKGRPKWAFMPRNLNRVEYNLIFKSKSCRYGSYLMGSPKRMCLVKGMNDIGGQENRKHFIGINFHDATARISAVRIHGAWSRNLGSMGVNKFTLVSLNKRTHRHVPYTKDGVNPYVFEVKDPGSSFRTAKIIKIDPPIDTQELLIFPMGYLHHAYMKFDVQMCFANPDNGDDDDTADDDDYEE